MNISMTNKQYETLLKLVQYGSWMTAARDIESEQMEYHELEQHVLSFANDFGAEGITFDAQYQLYDVSVERERDVQQVIDEYEEMVFWDKLAYYLARRDLTAELAQQPVSEEEASTRLIELEESYHEYFEENGVQHLRIDK